MSESSPACIDLARLRERFDDDKDLLAEIFSVFISESPGRRADIEAALAAGDLPRLAGLARTGFTLTGAEGAAAVSPGPV